MASQSTLQQSQQFSQSRTSLSSVPSSLPESPASPLAPQAPFRSPVAPSGFQEHPAGVPVSPTASQGTLQAPVAPRGFPERPAGATPTLPVARAPSVPSESIRRGTFPGAASAIRISRRAATSPSVSRAPAVDGRGALVEHRPCDPP
ncbi:uncharacterized protein LOC134785882 [Penaeus indicus]|uniref:uncharacterized protein LOC134785882 n=1 Tax=Penaeus indicus TaxID=29960 RepID=UPI00300C2538